MNTTAGGIQSNDQRGVQLSSLHRLNDEYIENTKLQAMPLYKRIIQSHYRYKEAAIHTHTHCVRVVLFPKP